MSMKTRIHCRAVPASLIAQTAITLVAFVMALTTSAFGQKLPAQLEQALPVEQVPVRGTFYSLTLDQPPLPFNPFPGLPVYAL